MRIGGGSEGSFGIVWVSHSGGAVPQAIGARSGGLDPPRGPTDQRLRGGADRPSRYPPDIQRAPRARGPEWIDADVEALCGFRPALPLATGHIGMDRFVLPAVPPFAVDGQFRLTAGLLAHPARRVGLVRSWKVPDGRPSESLVRHADSHPFPGPGCGLPAPQYPFRTAPGAGSFPLEGPS